MGYLPLYYLRAQQAFSYLKRELYAIQICSNPREGARIGVPGRSDNVSGSLGPEDRRLLNMCHARSR